MEHYFQIFSFHMVRHSDSIFIEVDAKVREDTMITYGERKEGRLQEVVCDFILCRL